MSSDQTTKVQLACKGIPIFPEDLDFQGVTLVRRNDATGEIVEGDWVPLAMTGTAILKNKKDPLPKNLALFSLVSTGDVSTIDQRVDTKQADIERWLNENFQFAFSVVGADPAVPLFRLSQQQGWVAALKTGDLDFYERSGIDPSDVKLAVEVTAIAATTTSPTTQDVLARLALVEQTDQTLANRCSSLDDRVNGLDRRTAGLESSTGGLWKQDADLSGRTDKTEAAISTLKAGAEELKIAVNCLKERGDQLAQEDTKLETWIKPLQTEVATITDKNSALERRADKLDGDTTKLGELAGKIEKRLHELEESVKHLRRHCDALDERLGARAPRS